MKEHHPPLIGTLIAAFAAILFFFTGDATAAGFSVIFTVFGAAITCAVRTVESFKPYQIDRSTRKVVCAACRHQDHGDMLIGPRHFDKTMHEQLKIMRRAYGVERKAWDQGFIDQHGVFMDREEAMRVAKAAGQRIDIERGCGGDEDTLYSEGLY